MGKVQGGMKCVKYLLFVFNFIFWLSGLLVLAVGLWLRFDPETVQLLTADDAPGTFFIAVYILLGAGGLMMVVGFFGCFGAVRESQCLLASLNCCGGSTPDEMSALCPEEAASAQDCLTAITDFFDEKLHIIGYIGIGMAGVMMIGMIFSMVLCCAIRNNREVI
ncbi:Tetraspanin-2 [Liparis tanakae]|uniref:Tetraspanin-2 n=1 Tax=Liparis tanakae TaxID=230148 RepID=A0A4Z2IEB7_9TELE|nr:Tetraspanin-2 [Liparis tanakae]